ncbi:MAG: hypothetical protein KME50_38700 [Nostoc desertorum CM1-VF14]|nr:hypothetical protein [Nostoc desertorum CM1-VF14]
MSVDHFHDYLINFGIAVKNFRCTVVLLVSDAYGGKLCGNDGIQQHT